MKLAMGMLACAGLVGCSDFGLGDGVANVQREGASVTTLSTTGGGETPDTTDGGGSTGSSGSTDCTDDETGSDDCTGGGGGDDDDGDGGGGRADLPYDARLEIGDTFVLTDAFLEEGPAPAAIVGVSMDDPQWRYAELSGLVPFTVDPTDCDHEGNRDTGRDRIEVTWQNADGSVETDHLDLRYCGA